MFSAKRYKTPKLFFKSFTLYIIILNFLILGQPMPLEAEEASNHSFPNIEFQEDDRILILAPHPDDEVLGCGGVIQRAVQLKLPIKIVFLTYGDNNQWSFLVYRKHPVLKSKAILKMGEVRRKEAIEAAKVLGLSPDQLIFLGYPDFRTLTIWYAHWQDQPPAKGMFSRVTAVPYSDAFRPGSPYKGEEILKDLKDIFNDFKPTKIFLSHPADHNPDHRALYLFSRIALWELEGQINPTLYPYLIHFKNWPQPKGDKPNEQITPPSLFEKEILWKTIDLTPNEVEINKKAIKQHRSQYISSTKYLLSFIRRNELFGDFAVINLKEKDYSKKLAQYNSDYFVDFPEGLREEEKVEFVGIEQEFLTLENEALIFTVRLSRSLSKEINLSFYAFGYRKDYPFSNMPKLHIMFKKKTFKVFDGGKLLSPTIVNIEYRNREIIIRIPIKALNYPQRILTSTRIYKGLVPLDWVEWRIIEIEN